MDLPRAQLLAGVSRLAQRGGPTEPTMIALVGKWGMSAKDGGPPHSDDAGAFATRLAIAKGSGARPSLGGRAAEKGLPNPKFRVHLACA
jgi:hypothetical protein